MPSVLAPLLDGFDLTAGAVVPIERYLSEDRALIKVALTGSLFVITTAKRRTWLVAILEAPEVAGMKFGDTRAPGCYGPTNATPITDITRLRLGRDLAEVTVLTAKQEAAIRALLDDEDRPVIEATAAAPATVQVDASAPPLARAVAHLANAQVVQAIDAMLEAWHASHAPELADLIDRATRTFPTHDRPLLESRYASPETARVWRRALADPARTLPQLLQNIDHEHFGSVKRLQAVCKLPIDPRIAQWAVSRAPRTWVPPGNMTRASDWWTPMSRQVLGARDVRGIPTLLAVEERHRTPEGGYDHPKLAAVFAFAHDPGEPPRALERADAAALALALDVLEAPLRTEIALVDAIAAAPDDPDATQIYADWLQERQHPRGEYIALECAQAAGTLSAAQTRRLAAFEDVPYLFGVIDGFATARMRPRVRGIDRVLTVMWSAASSIQWSRLAAQPLARALAKIELIGNDTLVHSDGLIAFANASPYLEEIDGVPAKLHRAIVDGTADRFAVRGGGVLRRRASR